jgi:hypothetical protein
MTEPHDLSEDEIASLLGELREPPRAWTEAAKGLPAVREEIAGILERAGGDDAYREAVLADLEGALREAGREPSPQAVAALRAGLTESGN